MTLVKNLLITCLLLIIIKDTFGANILAIFTLPVPSHYKVYEPIILELSARGHNVTYLSPFPLKGEVKNLRYIQVENNRGTLTKGGTLNLMMGISPFLLSASVPFMGKTHGDSIYPTKAIQDIVHSSDEYDAIISCTAFLQSSLSALQHKFDAIGIDIYPLGDLSVANLMSGLADNTNYMVDFKATTEKNIHEFNYYDRIYNFCLLLTDHLATMLSFLIYEMQANAYFNYPGFENRPPIKYLMANKSLIITNSHFSIGYPYPKAPHLKEIGGINVKEPKPLPKDIKKFMDEAQDGVIYFSLGTNFNSSWETSHQFRDTFVKVLSNLKQKVLWKWDSDSPPIHSEKIMFSKFFPQADLLAHPNLRLFITQGGILSIFEAVHHGVPMLCLPFIGDQPKNAQVVAYHGIGIRLNPEKVTESTLSLAINEILNDQKYARNAKKRSELYHDRQMKPLEEAIYWIEYVLKNGNSLQPKSVELSFMQLYNIDILITFSFTIFITKTIFNKIR